jgi:hypothetical protein
METASPEGILLLLVLFQVKHALADGPLQTVRMVREKGVYGKPVFWWALMAGQLMHQLTYLLLACAVIRFVS